MKKKVLPPTAKARERYALRMLYERCNGANWEPWGKNLNWCDDTKPLSEWAGVTVDHGRVVKLNVVSCRNFKGTWL